MKLNMYKHEIIYSFEHYNGNQLKRLRFDWDQLAYRFKSPLLCFDWFYCCAKTINKNDELRIIIVRQDNEIRAVAPFYVQKQKGYDRLELIGTSSLYEPCQIIYNDKNALRYLLEIAIRQKLPISLLRIPENDDINALCQSIKVRKSLIIKKKTSPSSYIDIKGDWDLFVRQLSSNRRYDLKRKRKKAEKLGDLAIECITPAAENFDFLFNLSIEIEDSSWKGVEGSSLLKNPQLKDFFQNYCKLAAQNKILRFFFLKINEKPVSMLIAIESQQTLWILKMGYHNEVSHCSPGIQLTHASIQHCFESKLKRYEFLGSAETWQSSWPTNRHRYLTILIFPYSLRSMISLASLVSTQLLKLKRIWLK